MNLNKYELVREKVEEYNINQVVRDAKDIFNFCRDTLRLTNRPDEHFYSFALDCKGNLIGVNEVSNGGYSSSIVDPKKVFSALLLNGASAVIFAHNHPSGVCEPSEEDRECTDRLKKAGDILGIQVLDHVVVGDYSYYSFASKGLI